MKKLLVILAMVGFGCSSEKDLITESNPPQIQATPEESQDEIPESPESPEVIPTTPAPPANNPAPPPAVECPAPPEPPLDFCKESCEKRGECNPQNGGMAGCLAECEISMSSRMMIPSGGNPTHMRQDWIDQYVDCFDNSTCSDVNTSYSDKAGKNCAIKAWENILPTPKVVEYCNKMVICSSIPGTQNPSVCIENLRWVSDKVSDGLLQSTWFNCESRLAYVNERLGFRPFGN